MNRMKKLRQLKNYTQRQMQELTGINQSTYSKLERSEQTLTTTQCISIADALETSTDYILGLTDQIQPHE